MSATCPCADYPARGACTGIRVRVVRTGSIGVRTSRARTLRARGFRARTPMRVLYMLTNIFLVSDRFRNIPHWDELGVTMETRGAQGGESSGTEGALAMGGSRARIPVHGRARTGMSARVCAHRYACTDKPLTGDVEAGRARPPAHVPPVREVSANIPPTIHHHSIIRDQT
ncbi:hypothetical protein C8R44DRAFT_727411 [Mycena epipterygia]|nr:hypothetical protein C8R44DRAFT_727411 [Mycena epipterygia]